MDEDLRSRFRRDFTTEPIRLPQQAPAESTARPTQDPAPAPAMQSADTSATVAPEANSPPGVTAQPAVAPKKESRKKLLIIPAVLVILAVAGGGYWYWSSNMADPIPASIRTSANFPLLYPDKLPGGYKIAKSSFTISNGIVQFQAVSGSSKIVFTVQQKPANFDFNSTFKTASNHSTTFTTALGQAATGVANGHPFGILATEQSWILVGTTSSAVSSTDIHQILQSVKDDN